MRALRHVFGAGPATRCGGGNSETAVLPALVLVVFAHGGPSRDEDGGMFGATRLHRDPLTRVGRGRFLYVGPEEPPASCGSGSNTAIPRSEVVLASGDHTTRHDDGGRRCGLAQVVGHSGSVGAPPVSPGGRGVDQPGPEEASVLISSTYWLRVIVVTASLVTSWITRGPGSPGLNADRRVV